MSAIGSYSTKPFSVNQKFLILDPSSGTTNLVLGQDIVDYIVPNSNFVFSESTRLAAESTDYQVGSIIQTSGATSVGDNLASTYLVVAGGTGDFPMFNGNDLLVLAGDDALRQQLISNAAGDGSDLVAHTGTTDTVTQALDKRTIYVGSVAELEALSVSIGANVKTLGYSNPGDGGGNDYEIVAGATGTADGGRFIDLNNGLQAKALNNGPIAKTPYSPKIAYILWTGQSNAVQPFDNGSPADVISPKAKIWNGTNFVQMAAGVGGISADATTHSLFNFTRNLADQCGYDEVRVIFVAVSGRPISDWVGTPADRTINSTNTPRMQEIIDAASAANVPEFTHIVMIQGEANASINTLPFPTNEPGSYSYEREYFRQSLSDQGFASADSKWLEVELIGKETGNAQWRINTAINALDKVGRPNVAIVPSYGFEGVDEGNTVSLNGTLVPWRQHFSSEENSELGNRLFRKSYELELIRDSKSITNHIIETAPDGKIGYTRPWVTYTSGTYDLSSRWSRGAVVVIAAGETVNINLLADDIRTGFGIAAGKTIQFKIENSATLNLTTETVDIFDKTGGNRPSTNSISRTGSAVSSEIIELVFQGLRWELVRDLSNYSASGATRWSIYDGLLHIAGYVNVGLNAGDFTEYTFPVDMPDIVDTGYIPTAEGACVCTNKTTSGFRVTRIATVTTGGTVSFQVFNAAMAAL